MSSVPHDQPISVFDCLDGEQTANQKLEYVEGIVYAIDGAINADNRIATNGTVALGIQLRGKSCQVFNSDDERF